MGATGGVVLDPPDKSGAGNPGPHEICYKTTHLFGVFGFISKTGTWRRGGKMNVRAEGPP